MEVTIENEMIDKFIDTFELNGDECRLCLKRANQVWELFEINNELPKKIMACAHIQIDQGDGLPTIICLTCRQLLDVSYNFKCQVENSDAKLRQLYQLKTPSLVEYETTTIEENDSMIQSVNQVISDVIDNGIKIHHSDTTTDNLKNSAGLVKLETTDSSIINNRESENCIMMVDKLQNNNLNNDQQNEILFKVDLNNENRNNKEQNEHNIREMAEDTNEQIIVDISRVVEPTNDVLVEKLDQFVMIKEENCVLADEESELSDDDDDNDGGGGSGEVYQNDNEIFVEQVDKIELMETINEEIDHYNEKNINEDEDDEEDDVDNDNNVDNDNDDDDDDEDDDEDDDDDDDDNDEAKMSVEKDGKNVIDEEKILNSRTRHKCTSCIKTFASTSALQRHIAIHNNNKEKTEFICYMCDKQFATVNKLKNHVLSTHDSLKNDEINDDGTNINNICEKTSEKIDEKNAIIDESPGKNDKKILKYSCKHCPKQFTYEKPFLTHAKRHPEYKDEQNKSTKIEDELIPRNTIRERLYESEDDDMPLEGLQCTQCGKLFATKRNLTRHLSTHTGLKFNCTTCSKEFSRLDKLKEHEQIKHKNEFFGQSDDDDDDDTDNEIKVNGTESSKKDKHNRPHKCPMCPKAFAQAQSLTNHMERHKRVKDTQKRFLCEVCSKCFAQSGSLVAHMRTHTGVKPYVCNVCSRAFTKSTYLQLHLRTHSGEKPYICQYCSRAFARANTLARHITMHTGEAKYHCQICMKSFRRLTSLNEHTYTHTGQRPYACKICTKRYNNAGSLYAHTKKCKAQQLTTGNNPTSYSNSNITVHEDVNNQSGGNSGAASAMLIYSQRKMTNDSTNIVNSVVNSQQSITTSSSSTSSSFMISNNVHNQKSSLTTNIIQQYTIEEPNVYTVDTKQFKTPYYTVYPGI